MRNDFSSAEWAARHLEWSRFAAGVLGRMRQALCWWEAHQQWPASEPARVRVRVRVQR
jgi:hypothetical protein